MPPAISPGGRPIRIARSERRRRSVGARLDGDTIVVMVPAGLPAEEEAAWASTMVDRIERKLAATALSDADLAERALALRRRYLPEGVDPRSIRWVTNQNSRWGSCSLPAGDIRVSDRLGAMPAYVQDAVITHELAHLVHPGHGPGFQAVMRRVPRHAEARAFLAGFALGAKAEIAFD